MLGYVSQEERYHNISNWALSVLSNHHIEKVFIEDYAFAATGRVFHIAENCGVLKYRMWMANYEITPIEEKKEISLSGKEVSVTVDGVTYTAVIK
jgi:hypothetical protein